MSRFRRSETEELQREIKVEKKGRSRFRNRDDLLSVYRRRTGYIHANTHTHTLSHLLYGKNYP